MRHTARVLFSIALLCLTVGAQTPPAPEGVFQLGDATVSIPAPNGFVPTFARIRGQRDRFSAFRATVAEIHVPAGVLSDLERDENIDLDFYTRVVIPEGSYIRDFSSDEFSELIASFEKQYTNQLDAKVARDVAARMRQQSVTFVAARPGGTFSMTTNLGYFARESNVFSGMALKRIQAFGRQTDLLVAMSVLYIRNRIVSTYFYRTFNDEKDATILRDAAKKWTTAILAANK